MCVTNTCNHSRRVLKIAPQHLTMNELHRVTNKSDSEEQATKDLDCVPSFTKDPVVVSSSIDGESRSSSTLSNTTHATTATDDEEEEYSSHSSSTSVRHRGGSCLKVRTQAQSLARKYHKPRAQHQNKQHHVDWDMVEFHTHNTILVNNPGEKKPWN